MCFQTLECPRRVGFSENSQSLHGITASRINGVGSMWWEALLSLGWGTACRAMELQWVFYWSSKAPMCAVCSAAVALRLCKFNSIMFGVEHTLGGVFSVDCAVINRIIIICEGRCHWYDWQHSQSMDLVFIVMSWAGSFALCQPCQLLPVEVVHNIGWLSWKKIIMGVVLEQSISFDGEVWDHGESNRVKW